MDVDSKTNLDALKKVYRNNPMVIYTGAGVSMGTKRWGLYSWYGLLEKVYKKGTVNKIPGIKERLKEHNNNPLGAADYIADQILGEDYKTKRKNMEEILIRVIIRKHFYKSHKQVKNELIDTDSTLNAVTAFCGELGNINNDIYECLPNKRIKAVITTNYDHLLEAAATTMYRKKNTKTCCSFRINFGKFKTGTCFPYSRVCENPVVNRP